MGFWTYRHAVTVLPAFAILLVVAVIMRLLLKGRSYEIRMLPIKIIAVLLILLEIGKQAYSISIGYTFFRLPFHFCSIFLYVLPFMAFYRGKGWKNLCSIASATMLGLFIGMLVMPGCIYSEEVYDALFSNYLYFHTVAFHHLVVFAFFITFFLDLHKPTGRGGELLFVVMFSVGFVAVSCTMAYVLDTNFSQFLYSTVTPIENLAAKIEAAVGTELMNVIYTSCCAALHIIFITGMNYLFLLLCVFKSKLTKKVI